MNGLYLTLPIFLPLVGGLVSYLIRFPNSRSRHLFYGVLICLTSAVTWLSILRCGSESFQLLRFTEELTLTLRMDGASRLFAGLAATLWPFTMLYAFDYMSHEKHLSMFWSFFTVSFGVTLGVAFAGNMMTMYLFYELLTLATLPLVMQPMSTTARKAGVKYAVYSMSGAALAFIGLVFLIVNGAQDFTLGGHLAGYTGDRQLLLTVFVTPVWYLLVKNPDTLHENLHFLLIQDEYFVPLIIQLLLVELIIDVLKLASLNTPDVLSNSFSMIGALILGDFAVQARWLVPEVLVYMAFVAIANYAQHSYEMGYATKLCRMLLLILVWLFDLWGLIAGVVGILLMMAVTKPLVGKGYLYPLIPFDGKKLKRLLHRVPIRKDNS